MRATGSVVSAEIAKDLVKLPTKEIEQHLAAIGELG
jgi:protein required for attachment to host cells